MADDPVKELSMRDIFSLARSGAEIPFLDVLSRDTRVREHLRAAEIKNLLDPAAHTGLSAETARKTSSRAYAIVNLTWQ